MRTLRKVHRVSALVIAGFVALHLLNHATAVLGADAHIRLMEILRVVYRNPIIEPLLLLVVAIQIVTGLRLFWKLRHASGNRLATIQRYAGLFLAFFLLSHVGAALYSRFVSHLDTNFYWAASVIVLRPYVYYYAPYYFLGVVAASTHIALGLRIMLLRQRVAFATSQRITYTMIAAGIVLASILILVLSGTLFHIELPHQYLLP